MKKSGCSLNLCGLKLQYHPDYLGHTEFVSDANGDAYQYFWYSPFGDAIVEEHANTASFSSRYLFNAMELDPETGRYYYGARYYDPGLSIWLSVDPLAHKFPSLSPYAFVANNPVNLLDPDGREIKIHGKDGTTTVYTPGMKYEGEDQYTQKVVNAYNKAYSGSAKANGMITDLVGSESTYNVRHSSTESGYDPNANLVHSAGNDDAQYFEKDTGGDIYWNDEGQSVPVQSDAVNVRKSELNTSAIAGLLHETAHAHDHLQGNLPSGSLMYKGLPVNEWQATHTENIIRSELGLSLRTYYKINSTTQKGWGQPLLRKKQGKTISNYLWRTNRDIHEY